MLGLNVVAADSDDEAQRLFTSHQQMSLGLRRGELGPLPPPVDPNHFQARLTPIERAELQDRLSAAVVGAPDTVRAGVADFIRRTSPDELIVAGQIFDHPARVYSYEILKEVMLRLPRAAQSEIQPVLES
jgi:alkanesulfonate monooxygenase SsuD/methylene tetrahydromethanopterin reductase-like flavin-dependent oxidoreductase (luciferase family)